MLSSTTTVINLYMCIARGYIDLLDCNILSMKSQSASKKELNPLKICVRKPVDEERSTLRWKTK